MEGRTGTRASDVNTERRKEEEEKGTDDRVGTCWEDTTEGERRSGMRIGTGQGQS